MAFGADAPHRPTQKVVWLIGFADGRRKVKDALCYSVFKERAEAIEKAPSLFQPKKRMVDYLKNEEFTKCSKNMA